MATSVVEEILCGGYDESSGRSLEAQMTDIKNKTLQGWVIDWKHALLVDSIRPHSIC